MSDISPEEMIDSLVELEVSLLKRLKAAKERENAAQNEADRARRVRVKLEQSITTVGLVNKDISALKEVWDASVHVPETEQGGGYLGEEQRAVEDSPA